MLTDEQRMDRALELLSYINKVNNKEFAILHSCFSGLITKVNQDNNCEIAIPSYVEFLQLLSLSFADHNYNRRAIKACIPVISRTFTESDGYMIYSELMLNNTLSKVIDAGLAHASTDPRVLNELPDLKKRLENEERRRKMTPLDRIKQQALRRRKV